jgi:hypothetical protein
VSFIATSFAVGVYAQAHPLVALGLRFDNDPIPIDDLGGCSTRQERIDLASL